MTVSVSRLALRRWVLPITSLSMFLLLWEILGRGGDPIISSCPSAVWSAFVHDLVSGQLTRAIAQSLPALLAGYVLAVLLGVPIGILLGRSSRAEEMFGFYFVGLDASPLIAFVPLFILWFGLGIEVRLMMVLIFCITPIVINTWRGVRAVPSTLIDVGRAFGASAAQITSKIVLPSVLPAVLTGLRLGIGRAVIATAISEIFTAMTGLGGLLLRRSESYDMAGSLVPALVLMGMGIVLTGLLAAVERRLLSWSCHRDAL